MRLAIFLQAVFLQPLLRLQQYFHHALTGRRRGSGADGGGAGTVYFETLSHEEGAVKKQPKEIWRVSSERLAIFFGLQWQVVENFW